MEKGFKERLIEKIVKKLIKKKLGIDILFDVENVELNFHKDDTTGLLISNLYILVKNEDIEKLIKGE